MSKKARSFSVDEDVVEELSARDDMNASAIVNNFLRDYLAQTDNDQDAVLREINRQIEKKEERIEEEREELEELRARREAILNAKEEERSEKCSELYEKVRRVPKETDHTLVQKVADELDKTPEQVLEEAYQ